MISSSTPCIDHTTAIESGQSPNTAFVFSTLRALIVGLLLLCCMFAIDEAAANPLGRADAAFARGDYVRAVNILAPLAFGGDARAQAVLGLMFEHGYGAPQVYDSAAGLYGQAAMRGNPFGQAMFGLMYDKGHGVPQDFVLAYKWLNLAACSEALARPFSTASRRRRIENVLNCRGTATRHGMGDWAVLSRLKPRGAKTREGIMTVRLAQSRHKRVN